VRHRASPLRRPIRRPPSTTMTNVQTSQALAEIRDTQAYLLAGHPSFNSYLEGRWDMSCRKAFHLLAASFGGP
jgi:hypothetical protein